MWQGRNSGLDETACLWSQHPIDDHLRNILNKHFINFYICTNYVIEQITFLPHQKKKQMNKNNRNLAIFKPAMSEKTPFLSLFLATMIMPSARTHINYTKFKLTLLKTQLLLFWNLFFSSPCLSVFSIITLFYLIPQ